MKRILSLVLCMMLVLTSFAFVANADPVSTLAVTTDKDSVAVGEEIKVTVGFSEAVSTITFEIGLQYDTESFEFVSETHANNLGSAVVNNKANLKQVYMVDAGSEGKEIAAGSLMEVTFKAIKAGENIKFESVLVNDGVINATADDIVEVALDSKTVTVTEAAAPETYTLTYMLDGEVYV